MSAEVVVVTGASAGVGRAAAAEAVERELGPIDVWVNNAMTSASRP